MPTTEADAHGHDSILEDATTGGDATQARELMAECRLKRVDRHDFHAEKPHDLVVLIGEINDRIPPRRAPQGG